MLATPNGRLVRQGPVTQDAVKQIITHAFGDKGEMGGPLVRNITLTPEADGTFVQLDLNRTDCPMIGMQMICTADQLPGVAATFTRSIMSILFEYPDVSRVQINLYSDLSTMVDMNSTQGMNEVMVASTVINRQTADKIDWSMYNASNAARMASSYWLDPRVPTTGAAASGAAASGAAPAPSATTPAPATPPSGAGTGGNSTGGGMSGMPGM